MSAVEVSVETGLVLRLIRAQRTVELWLDAAFVLQVPGQTRVVIVHLTAVLARISYPLPWHAELKLRLWKMQTPKYYQRLLLSFDTHSGLASFFFLKKKIIKSYIYIYIYTVVTGIRDLVRCYMNVKTSWLTNSS